MEQPEVLADDGFGVFFYFTGGDGLPTPLDPRIGTLDLYQVFGTYDPVSGEGITA